MIVCHCKAVCDRTIRAAVERGARTPSEVALACNAGRHCGGCLPAVEALIESETGGATPLPVPTAAAS